MKTLSFLKKSIYSALVFFGTLMVLSVGYAVWNTAMSKVNSGSPLTATTWNAFVDNIDDLNSRWSRVGSDITFTGGNVGIGGTNPNKLYIYSTDTNKTAVTIYRPIAAFTDNIFNHTSLFLGGSDQGYGLAMGVRGDNKVFLQGMVNNIGTGSNTSILLAPDSGNVGIGTTSPYSALHVVKTSAGAATSPLVLQNNSATDGTATSLDFVSYNSYAPTATITNTKNDNNGNYTLSLGTYGNMAALNIKSGNVGIGIPSPGAKLDVNGTIRNSAPINGYLELSADLPGYGTTTYPTIRTSFTNLYFSAGGAFSAYMTAGGTWTIPSDKNKKENITELNYQEILRKIDELPITQWNYKMEDSSIRHIGPFAQDFHALFDLNGPSDKMISTTDPSGVALAGIKGLSEKDKIHENRITVLEKQNQELKFLVCLDHPDAEVCK